MLRRPSKISTECFKPRVERSQVVFCRVYTPSNEYWGPINAVYAQFFGEHKPGRVVVSTTPLHFGCLVEIECIAELEAHD